MPENNANTSHFPGEGRGPVARQLLAGVALSYFHLRDWAPAFAGEALVVGP